MKHEKYVIRRVAGRQYRYGGGDLGDVDVGEWGDLCVDDWEPFCKEFFGAFPGAGRLTFEMVFTTKGEWEVTGLGVVRYFPRGRVLGERIATLTRMTTDTLIGDNTNRRFNFYVTAWKGWTKCR